MKSPAKKKSPPKKATAIQLRTKLKRAEAASAKVTVTIREALDALYTDHPLLSLVQTIRALRTIANASDYSRVNNLRGVAKQALQAIDEPLKAEP